MNIARENIDELNAVLTLTVEKNDYEQKVDEVLKQQRKKVNMPGFRKGKVPMGLVKKMYGQQVLFEQVNRLISESLYGYIKENNISVLGEPLPTENSAPVDFDNDSVFEFKFDIGLEPEFNLTLNKKNKLPLYNIEITDEMLDEQIKDICDRFAEEKEIDKSDEKSYIKLKFVQLDEKGEVVESGLSSENTVTVSTLKDEVKDKFIGVKTGDVVKENINNIFVEKNVIASIFNVDDEIAKDINSDFNFTVEKIYTFIPAELNQELFDKAVGKGVVSSVEELKEKVKETIQKTYDFEIDYKFLSDAKKSLLKKADMQLPEAFLKRWILATNKENEKFEADKIDENMPLYLDDLKWQLIKNKIIVENEIKLEEEEIKAAAVKAAKLEFMRYGMSEMPEEQYESFANVLLEKEEQRRSIAEKAAEDKVLDKIKELIKIDEKTVSREEFNKLLG